MRIIAGDKRGLKLISPEDDSVRPTYDKVKEAIFGRLQFSLYDKNILDLFAGSGALGLEALSRGAKFCCFCDNSSKSCAVVKKNIAALGYEDKSELLNKDYKLAINFFKNRDKFDIVFIDPPYASDHYENAVRELAEADVLNDEAQIVLESDRVLNISVPNIKEVKQKKYGKTYVTYLEYTDEK